MNKYKKGDKVRTPKFKYSVGRIVAVKRKRNGGYTYVVYFYDGIIACFNENELSKEYV